MSAGTALPKTKVKFVSAQAPQYKAKVMQVVLGSSGDYQTVIEVHQHVLADVSEIALGSDLI